MADRMPDTAHSSSFSYYTLDTKVGTMQTHVVLMLLAWTTILPIAIMLKIATSMRYCLSFLLLFHVLNTASILAAISYNDSTPDLYVGNVHHTLGWITTLLVTIWSLNPVCAVCTRTSNIRRYVSFFYSPTLDAKKQGMPPTYYIDGAALTQESCRPKSSGSQSSSLACHPRDLSTPPIVSKDDCAPFMGVPHNRAQQKSQRSPENDKIDYYLSSTRWWHGLSYAMKYMAGRTMLLIQSLLLVLAFVCITSGCIVYAGLFHSREIYNGTAHFIKGGIFFWYGLLTLGRWMGAFADYGWAWNIRPASLPKSTWRDRLLSAEFVESSVICLYGMSNIFLEHLANWGGEWSAVDYEHVAITILFFGGGLLGIVIECERVAGLLSTAASLSSGTAQISSRKKSRRTSFSRQSDHVSRVPLLEDRASDTTAPLNPMPGLVIFILGAMMSSHTQSSMTSTMLHAQWGSLFYVFALARAGTYVIIHLKPLTSHVPSRPPTELISSFCLVSGGLLLMMSARDVVNIIDLHGLDAMAVFTVTMGFTCVILAWTIVVYAILVYATRRERILLRGYFQSEIPAE